MGRSLASVDFHVTPGWQGMHCDTFPPGQTSPGKESSTPKGGFHSREFMERNNDGSWKKRELCLFAARLT